MKKIMGFIVLYVILILTAISLVPEKRSVQPLRNPQTSLRPTGDFCSEKGDFMFYLRRISGPDACFKESK